MDSFLFFLPLTYRIVEWICLEGTINYHVVPTLGQRHLRTDQFAQNPNQPLASNSCRDVASTASLGNLFQCLTTLIIKNFFVTYNLNLLFQL